MTPLPGKRPLRFQKVDVQGDSIVADAHAWGDHAAAIMVTDGSDKQQAAVWLTRDETVAFANWLLAVAESHDATGLGHDE